MTDPVDKETLFVSRHPLFMRVARFPRGMGTGPKGGYTFTDFWWVIALTSLDGIKYTPCRFGGSDIDTAMGHAAQRLRADDVSRSSGNWVMPTQEQLEMLREAAWLSQSKKDSERRHGLTGKILDEGEFDSIVIESGCPAIPRS